MILYPQKSKKAPPGTGLLNRYVISNGLV